MPMMGFISVHITVPSRSQAEHIADVLVDRKLAACVNMLTSVQSVYRWRGKVERGEEILLMAKTRADLFPQLEKQVKALHPDKTPCILALPIIAGHQSYLDWVAEETEF